jgi:hypothetical protein
MLQIFPDQKLSADLLKVEEIAIKLGVKPSWIYAHAEALGAYHLGKYLRFSWERVLERLDQGFSGNGLGTKRG